MLELLENFVGIVQRLRLVAGRGRQEDLADVIFLGALGRVHAVDNRLHLVVADADAALDLGALQPLPGDLALDLPAHRADRRAVGWR